MLNLNYSDIKTKEFVEETTKDQYLTFVLDNEEYGIEIEFIREIISVCSITKVPETPPYLKGIINLRGDIIPVIDVRCRFLKEPKEYDEFTCIIFIEYGEHSLGLIVDKVKEVIFINEQNVAPPPNSKLNFKNQFIKSIGIVGTEVKLILDLDKVIS